MATSTNDHNNSTDNTQALLKNLLLFILDAEKIGLDTDSLAKLNQQSQLDFEHSPAATYILAALICIEKLTTLEQFNHANFQALIQDQLLTYLKNSTEFNLNYSINTLEDKVAFINKFYAPIAQLYPSNKASLAKLAEQACKVSISSPSHNHYKAKFASFCTAQDIVSTYASLEQATATSKAELTILPTQQDDFSFSLVDESSIANYIKALQDKITNLNSEELILLKERKTKAETRNKEISELLVNLKKEQEIFTKEYYEPKFNQLQTQINTLNNKINAKKSNNLQSLIRQMLALFKKQNKAAFHNHEKANLILQEKKLQQEIITIKKIRENDALNFEKQHAQLTNEQETLTKEISTTESAIKIEESQIARTRELNKNLLELFEEASVNQTTLNTNKTLLMAQFKLLNDRVSKQTSKQVLDIDQYHEFYRNAQSIELNGQKIIINHDAIVRKTIDGCFTKALNLSVNMLDFIKQYITLNYFCQFPAEMVKIQKAGDKSICNYLADNPGLKKAVAEYALIKIPTEANALIFNCKYRLLDIASDTAEIEANVSILLKEVNGKITTSVLNYTDNADQWLKLHPSVATAPSDQTSVVLSYKTIVTAPLTEQRTSVPHPIFQGQQVSQNAINIEQGNSANNVPQLPINAFG